MKDVCSLCGLTAAVLADTSSGLPAETLATCRRCGVLACLSSCTEVVRFEGYRWVSRLCRPCYLEVLAAEAERQHKKGETRYA